MSKPSSLKLPAIIVENVSTTTDPSTTWTGIRYIDTKLTLTGEKRSEKVNMLFDKISELVTEHSSLLLYKEDVKRLADQLETKSCSSKDIFLEIRRRIRAEYDVLKLTFNPRTLEFNGVKTCFIIHKRIIY